MMNSLLVTLCLTGLVNEVLCYQVVPLSNTGQHRTTRVSSSTSLASTSPLFTSTSTSSGRSSSTRRTFKQLRVPTVSSLVDSNTFSNTFSNNQNNVNRDSGKLFSTAVPVETEPATANDEGNNDEGIGAWIPLASVDSLKGLGPQRITTMNVDFVVWHTPVEDKKLKKMRGKDLQWVVQADACSHRLAPLSQGRVDPKSGCIECPYHGWQFDTEGNVTAIPQLDDGSTIENVQKRSSTRVQTFPVHVAGGMLFAFLPSSLHGEMFQQSLLPEEYYPFLNESKDASIYVRDLPYSFDFLVENFMDPAHIPFAHHKLQSSRDDGVPVEMKELVRYSLFFYMLCMYDVVM
jgi:nitrite reductase/ring-hydroxylating ferredoxin subunit